MAKQLSIEALRGQALRRGTAASDDDFQVKRVEIDELRMAHTRFQQMYGGVPVWEGEAIVHLKADGSVSTITDDMKGSIAVDTHPSFSERLAIRYALKAYDGNAQLSDIPKVELYVYRADDGDRLVYRIETPRIDGSDDTCDPVYFIDAHTGELVDQYDNLQTGTGTGRYNGQQTIATSSSGSTFYLEDLTRKQGTFN